MLHTGSFGLAARLASRFTLRNMTSVVECWRPVRVNPGTDVGMVLKRVYFGPARLHNVGGPNQQVLGDELTTFAGSTISTPVWSSGAGSWDAQFSAEFASSSARLVDVHIDDMFKVLKHSDPLVVDRMFRVIDVDSGGQFRVFRQFQVSIIQPSAEWRFVDEPVTPEW